MIGQYILKGHEPIECFDLTVWGHWMQISDRRVALDEFPWGKVSTVFLGLDHSFHLQGEVKPILFETMVFGGEYDGEQERYATWDEAEAGHKAMIEKVKGNANS